LPPRRLRPALAGLFALSALAILAVAEPFAEGLVEMGRQAQVDDFILVQIVAPLASEAPEFIVVALFVMAGRAGTGLAALISSKVNQWTLLVGSIPLVYSLALGRPQAFALDNRQTEELLLTAAQGLLAVLLVFDRRLGLFESLLLLVLYCGQFLVPAPEARMVFAFGYFALAILTMLVSPAIRRGVAGIPRRSLKELRSLLAPPAR
jgi:cation:H+ antiporter